MTQLLVTAVTNVGHVRELNQDRIVAGPWILAPDRPDIATVICPPGASVAAVLDGMGGHAGGEIAALTAADIVASCGDAINGALSAKELVTRANAAVYRRMAELPQLAGMGTTLAGIALVGDDAVLFNVGDARVYVVANTYLLQVSTDDAAPSGALTQSLGGRAAFEPVDAHVVVEPAIGRRFLLATDGLFGHLGDVELDHCLTEDDEATVSALVRAALDGGGPDNISIALVRTMADLTEVAVR